MKKLMFAAALVSSMCAFAQEAEVTAPDASEKEDTGKCWLVPSVYFAGTFETASYGRSMIFNDRPAFETDLDLSWSLGDFGNIGFYNWTSTDFTGRNHLAQRRMLNEVDYGAYYNYDWKFADGYHLSNQVQAYWMTYDGQGRVYGGGKKAHTDFEWQWGQTLGTPFIDVYYMMRIGVQDGSAGHYDNWLWTNIGFKHGFEVCDAITITPRMDFDLGNSNMYAIRNHSWEYNGGTRDDRKTGRTGLMTMRPSIRLDYALSDNVNLFAKVTEFITNDRQLRDGYHGTTRRDITIFSCGFELMF